MPVILENSGLQFGSSQMALAIIWYIWLRSCAFIQDLWTSNYKEFACLHSICSFLSFVQQPSPLLLALTEHSPGVEL